MMMQFTDQVTQSVLANTTLSLLRTALADSALRERLGFAFDSTDQPLKTLALSIVP